MSEDWKWLERLETDSNEIIRSFPKTTSVYFMALRDRKVVAAIKEMRSALLFISSAGNPNCQEALQAHADETLTRCAEGKFE